MTKILETSRLVLREWTHENAEKLFEVCGEAQVLKYLGTGKLYDTIEQVREFLLWAVEYQAENKFCRWALTLVETEEIICSCGFARPYGT